MPNSWDRSGGLVLRHKISSKRRIVCVEAMVDGSLNLVGFFKRASWLQDLLVNELDEESHQESPCHSGSDNK